MKIIISPAKKIRSQVEFPQLGIPKFLSHAQEIYAAMTTLDYPALNTLWNCSDKIAQADYTEFFVLLTPLSPTA